MEVEAVTTTETSLIGSGTCRGKAVVLKVARTDGEEWRSGEVLAAFDGNGLVTTLEFDAGVVLLERLTPGNNLSTLSIEGRDDDATEIIADVIGRMSCVRPALQGIASARDLLPGFQKYRHTDGSLMPIEMVDRAERVFADLCDSQTDVRLLHGDLHHYNVLFDSRRGWVAIDPSAVQAEIEFEVGASLRNPYDAPELLGRPETVLRRLEIYRKALGLDADRALRWAFSASVLAALWPTEEGVWGDPRVPFISAATAMMPLLDGR